MSVREGEDPESRENLPGEDAEQNGVVLEITDLHAGYGEVPVLHGMSLALHEGEAIGIVGHNGMGKTTLLKTIMGLLPSRGGKIVIDGVDVTSWAAHERSRLGVAYVPQGRGILAGLSAQENLRLAWTPDSGETEERAIERVVGIFPRLSRLLGPQGRRAVGRRATDPRPGARPGAAPLAPSARRAVGGHPALDHRGNRRAAGDLARQAPPLDAYRRAEPRTGARCRKPHRSGGARADHPRARAPRPCAAGRSPISSGSALRGHVGSAHRGGAAGRQSRAIASRANGPARRHRTEPRPSAASPNAKAASRSRNSATAAPAAATTSLGGPMSTVRRPTLEQMHDIVSSLHMSMSEGEVAEYLEVLEGTFQSYDRGQSAAGLSAAGALSAHARLPAGRQREPAQRLGGEGRSARRRPRTAVRQARRAQGQHLPRGRADDERRLDA